MAVRTKSELETQISSLLADNDTGAISEADVRSVLTDVVDSVALDSEITAAAIRSLLGLSSSEINDLFTGATISGQTLTFTQNDGTTVPIAIPTATAGSGDGVVQSGAIDDDGTELTLTLDTGGTVVIDLPSVLREMAGITEARVQELIEATELSALAGSVTDAQIPDAIMRDAELTAAAVRTLLSLTSTEVNDLLTGASLSQVRP